MDSLLQSKGVEGLDACMNEAPDGLTFCMNTLRAEYAPRGHHDVGQEFF